MKTKIFKRITAAMLAAVMTVTSVSASAESVNKEEKYTIEEYIMEVTPVYLASRNFDASSTYYASNIFEVDNSDPPRYYSFIFQDNDISGKLEINFVDGNYYSVFDTDIQSEIKEMYVKNEEIAFVVNNNNTFVVSETSAVAIDSIEKADFVGNASLQTPITKTTPIEYNLIVNASANARSASLGSKTLSNFSFVPNQDTGSGYVLCWAACVAMTVNYLLGYTPSSSNFIYADDVSKAVGTTTGTNSAVKNAYTKYGYTANNTNGPSNPNTVFQKLSSGKPVHINVQDSDQGLTHALEIYSIYIYTDKTVYTFYDPSILNGTPQSVIASGNPTPTSSSFLYVHTYSGVSYSMEWITTFFIA